MFTTTSWEVFILINYLKCFFIKLQVVLILHIKSFDLQNVSQSLLHYSSFSSACQLNSSFHIERKLWLNFHVVAGVFTSSFFVYELLLLLLLLLLFLLLLFVCLFVFFKCSYLVLSYAKLSALRLHLVCSNPRSSMLYERTIIH